DRRRLPRRWRRARLRRPRDRAASPPRGTGARLAARLVGRRPGAGAVRRPSGDPALARDPPRHAARRLRDAPPAAGSALPRPRLPGRRARRGEARPRVRSHRVHGVRVDLDRAAVTPSGEEMLPPIPRPDADYEAALALLRTAPSTSPQRAWLTFFVTLA